MKSWKTDSLCGKVITHKKSNKCVFHSTTGVEYSPLTIVYSPDVALGIQSGFDADSVNSSTPEVTDWLLGCCFTFY